MADDVSLSFYASLSHNYSGICQIHDSKKVLMDIVDIYTLFEVSKAAGKQIFSYYYLKWVTPSNGGSVFFCFDKV